jgi:hypothetical protein
MYFPSVFCDIFRTWLASVINIDRHVLCNRNHTTNTTEEFKNYFQYYLFKLVLHLKMFQTLTLNILEIRCVILLYFLSMNQV